VEYKKVDLTAAESRMALPEVAEWRSLQRLTNGYEVTVRKEKGVLVGYCTVG
jgi:L-amino acid N-acyltransferase YncA